MPQGGGDHHTGHRCAGEWLTIALMKVALRQLTAGMECEVPAQDLEPPMWRMPSLPKDRFRIRGVRRAGVEAVGRPATVTSAARPR